MTHILWYPASDCEISEWLIQKACVLASKECRSIVKEIRLAHGQLQTLLKIKPRYTEITAGREGEQALGSKHKQGQEITAGRESRRL